MSGQETQFALPVIGPPERAPSEPKRRRIRRVINNKAAFFKRQLTLALEVLKPVIDAAEKALAGEAVALDWSQAEMDTWVRNMTLEQVIEFHDQVLCHQIHQLGDPRVSLGKKRDIWSWMGWTFDSDIEAAQHPFTFHACCVAAGVEAESFREQLVDLLRRMYTGRGSFQQFIEKLEGVA